ncbi:MAG: PIN domain-containing protein [Coriobacteriales bacterium]|jgi:predicted nucleic-acid-binding protein|nr:PIN domain-containing protein [Coriobacteriales bacterium]
MQFVDANYVLRYLLNDDPIQSTIAKGIIEANHVELPVEALSEVVYVLNGRYGLSREQVCETMKALIDESGIGINREKSIFAALTYYSESKLDFVDCLLAARAIMENATIHTFDKKLRKFIDHERAIVPSSNGALS